MLGTGGMGQVFRAYDTELQREVAIKMLPPQAAADPAFEQRFRREARTAAGLDEPHIVPIFDFGRINDRLFLSMQLVDGTDLATLIERYGPMPPELAVSITEQAASALDVAHAAGLVHRDVKPANLLVTANHYVYLIDFGIARAADDTVQAGGSGAGTLAYMAPERFGSGAIDLRTDVYALTCVLHQCLTGNTPYPAETPEQAMFGHLSGPPPRPSVVRPGLPPALDAVIARGMAAKPDHRYQSSGELARSARIALNAPAPAGTPVPSSKHTPRRRLVSLIAIAAVLALIAGGAAYWQIHRTSSPPTASSPRSVTATIAVGAKPTGIAVDPGSHTAYVTNKIDGTVSVIDTVDNTVKATVDVGADPTAIAVDPLTRSAYATSWQDDSITVIDSSHTVAATVQLAPYHSGMSVLPTGVAVDPDTHTAYVSSHGDGATHVFDTADYLVGDPITMPPITWYSTGVAVDSRVERAYVSNLGDGDAKGTIEVIDTARGEVTDSIPVGHIPAAVAVDTVNQAVYAVNRKDNTMSVIDAVAKTVTATIDVGAAPTAVAVDSVAATVFVVNRTDGTVSVVDAKTNSITAVIEVGDEPSAVAVDADTHTAYVALDGADSVAVITVGNVTNGQSSVSAGPDENTTTHHELAATIEVGRNPNRVAIDPAARRLYVTHYEDAQLSVVDTTTHAVVARIDVGSSPSGVAVDPELHTAYVGGWDDGTVSVIDTVRNTVVSTIPVGKHVMSLAIDPVTHTAYVASMEGGAKDSLSVFDIKTNTVTAKHVVECGSEIALDAVARRIFATCSIQPRVVVIDLDSGATTAGITVGKSPYSAAVAPAAHSVYVPNHADSTVSVIDTVDNVFSVPVTLQGFTEPTAVAVDSGIGTAYVVNEHGGSLSVIDTETNTVTGKIRVGNKPRALTVDPDTHTVYAINSGDGTVAVVSYTG